MTEKKKKNILDDIKPENIEIRGGFSGTDYEKSLVDNFFISQGNNDSNENVDTFFKNVIEKLFSRDNIELKTDYISDREIFIASKLSFMGDFFNIPVLSEFINTLERKKVSKERKSRVEIVKSLWQREEGIREQERRSIEKNLNI